MDPIDELVDVSDGKADRVIVTPSDSFDRPRGVSVLIMLAVSVCADTAPDKLSPLYSTVDPSSLDSLVGDAVDEARPTVRFEYEGYDVTLRPGPRVALSPTE